MSQPQIITDAIYGKFTIGEPVLLDLIQSQPVQRLKKIAQFGIPDKYYHLRNYPRYDHCIGVMLLLRSLNASEEEQIAGLLHDVSHTAFSHVIDWVVGDGKTEEYQNQQHTDFVQNSELSKILKRNKYDPKRLADYHHFTLLEQDIPHLCADRVDYSLREFPLSVARICYYNLIVYNKKVVFKNKKSALFFAQHFLKKQHTHWGGFEAVTRYRYFANALRLALDEHIIDFNDFWQYDDYVIQKLIHSKNNKIKSILHLLEQPSLTHLPISSSVVYKKFRYVDPEFLDNQTVYKLSSVDSSFRKALDKARELNEQGIHLPAHF